MKEYYENKWSRNIFAFISFLMCLVSIWIIWSRESTFVVVGGLAMFGLFLYPILNSFVYKIQLSDDFIIEKSLFQTKQIFFKDITHINLQNFFAEFISNKKKIYIGKFFIRLGDEIIKTVVSKIKENPNLLIAGDPIIFQTFINDLSMNTSLPDNNENNPSEFVEKAELIKKRWLFREVNLETSKGNYKITYYGRGAGYECIFVNDELVSKKDSALWYVPNFNFSYHDLNLSVNVRVYPWFAIRKFWIEVNNKTVYSE